MIAFEKLMKYAKNKKITKLLTKETFIKMTKSKIIKIFLMLKVNRVKRMKQRKLLHKMSLK